MANSIAKLEIHCFKGNAKYLMKSEGYDFYEPPKTGQKGGLYGQQ